MGLAGASTAADGAMMKLVMGEMEEYFRPTGGEVPNGFVVVPGHDLLLTCPNTVAVVCSSSSLSLELADQQEHEVLALIDRDDPATYDPSAYEDRAFYALSDPQGVVQIRWMASVPADWKVLGKLLYAQIPFVVKPGSGSGFAEASDDFEF